MKPKRAGIALGSNLGNRLENLRNAREHVRSITGVHPPLFQSAIYETAAVNCEPGAGDFYNATIEIGFEGLAESLFRALQQIEEALGRMPESRTRSGNRLSISRPIDLDLLYFGEERIDLPQLQLPHPRMIMRRFVLQPLADINPDLQLPDHPATVRELLAGLPPDNSVKRVIERW